MNISEYSESFSSIEFSEKHRRILLMLFVFLFPVMFTSLVFSLVVVLGGISFPKIIPTKTEIAEIVLPINKASVNKKFTIAGSINDLPEGYSIYLLENREGLYWPKYTLGNKATTWTKSLTNHAGTGQYSAYLLAKVDTDGKKVFEDWFNTSKKTGKYPGIADIEFADVVARVRVKAK